MGAGYVIAVRPVTVVGAGLIWLCVLDGLGVSGVFARKISLILAASASIPLVRVRAPREGPVTGNPYRAMGPAADEGDSFKSTNSLDPAWCLARPTY